MTILILPVKPKKEVDLHFTLLHQFPPFVTTDTTDRTSPIKILLKATRDLDYTRDKVLILLEFYYLSLYSELPSGMFSENMFDACTIELERLISNLSRKESIDTSIQLISRTNILLCCMIMIDYNYLANKS
ncbi:hypothetical protein Glove_155g126 [Diversispora epigaea]|uniref:Uncharacterized protein n=1 Tax=Diversispora epigaea TaxID=1348612 RepID=A0A397ISF4_9GLOM|nr:hypothetical protein Glove_155g126 [Diversispora epigaea]